MKKVLGNKIVKSTIWITNEVYWNRQKITILCKKSANLGKDFFQLPLMDFGGENKTIPQNPSKS